MERNYVRERERSKEREIGREIFREEKIDIGREGEKDTRASGLT